jgi:hypothetical protein
VTNFGGKGESYLHILLVVQLGECVVHVCLGGMASAIASRRALAASLASAAVGYGWRSAAIAVSLASVLNAKGCPVGGEMRGS